MNASTVVPSVQPSTDTFSARIAEQQCYNSMLTALLNQQPENNRNIFSSFAVGSPSLNLQPNSVSSLTSGPSSISSLSTPSCSSASLLNPADTSPLMIGNQLGHNNSATQLLANTKANPTQNASSGKPQMNVPMMFFNMPSTSESSVPYLISKHSTASSESVPPTQCSKNEPSALQLPAVPKCSICGADSTGIHFGVESCAACSAFFRRTVVLNKNYLCPKDGNCTFNFDSPAGQKCRSCRFRKCIDVGMDRNAVQHRRDAIGKYSATVKRECSSPLPEYQSSLSEQVLSPPTPKSPKLPQPTVLEELNDCYDTLNKRRKIFYSTASVASLFEEGELEPHELENFGDCMFQLYRVEPRLCVEFIGKNRFLTSLESDEKTKILTQFILHFQAIEEPYLTWKFGGEQNRYWMMPNRTYIDLTKTDYYFDSNKAIMKELNLDKASAVRLFQPSFTHAMETIGSTMSAIGLTKVEMVCLIGLMLFDPSIPGIQKATRERLKVIRDQLLKDMMNYYEGIEVNAALRLANVILVISSVRIHAQRTRENMHMLKIFDIIPRDQLFDEICGLKTDEMLSQDLKELIGKTNNLPQNSEA
uniref:Uncharacterized protein n=1 Tax=Panagrolaimus sp. JU765 TaxID=591449 RepID=A0AC34PV10_9BILA